MTNLPARGAMVGFLVLATLPGCTSCGGSDGWERVFNPFCRQAEAPAPHKIADAAAGRAIERCPMDSETSGSRI